MFRYRGVWLNGHEMWRMEDGVRVSPGSVFEEIPSVMWRSWTNHWLNFAKQPAETADSAQARVVPHQDWSAWLAHEQNAALHFDEEALRRRLNQAHETIMEWSVRMRIYSDDGRHDLATAYAGKIVGLAPEHLGALAVLRLKGKSAKVADSNGGELSETVRIDKTPESPVPDLSVPQAPATELSPVHGFWQVSLDRAGSWLLTTSSTVCFGEEPNAGVAEVLGLGPQARGLRLDRDEEGCWLISTEGDGLTLNGKPTRSGCLMDGAKLRLADGPELHFWQPRMETGTARLERAGKPSRKGLQGLVLLGDFMRVGGTSADLPHAELPGPLVVMNQGGRLVAREGRERGDQPIQPPQQMRLENVGIFWELHRLT